MCVCVCAVASVSVWLATLDRCTRVSYRGGKGGYPPPFNYDWVSIAGYWNNSWPFFSNIFWLLFSFPPSTSKSCMTPCALLTSLFFCVQALWRERLPTRWQGGSGCPLVGPWTLWVCVSVLVFVCVCSYSMFRYLSKLSRSGLNSCGLVARYQSCRN